MLKQRIEQELKQALLAKETERVTTLRGIKSVILYEEVAKGLRDQGLDDAAIIVLLAKEAKKRQDSADLYVQGGSEERAAAELREKAIIESYLPKQLSDEELLAVIDDIVSMIDDVGPQAMGQVIGQVKQRTAGQADGSRVAQFVKERLTKA